MCICVDNYVIVVVLCVSLGKGVKGGYMAYYIFCIHTITDYL